MRSAIFVFAGLPGAILFGQSRELVKVGEYQLLTGRTGAAVVADGDYVYVIGGYHTTGVLSDIERFDIRTHEITRLTNKLIPRGAHDATVFEGRIYIVGGFGYSLQPVRPEKVTEIYDLASGEIRRGADMPTPRVSAATALLNGGIYVIGGERIKAGSLTQTNITEVYDIAHDRWRKGLPMPTPRAGAAAVVESFIIVAGGRSAGVARDDVEFFSPRENVWKILPKLSQPVQAHSMVFLEDALYLFGNSGREQDVMAYDMRRKASHVIKVEFKPARYTAATAHQGLIYVVGGMLDQISARDYIQVFGLREPGATERP